MNCGLRIEHRVAAGPPGPQPYRLRPLPPGLYKQSQFAQSYEKRQVLCGKRFMVNWTSKRLRRNKANSQQCRVERGRADGGRGCSNKAICQAEARGGRAAGSIDRAKQSQFRRRRNERQVVGGTVVMRVLVGFRGMKNKANSAAESERRGQAPWPVPPPASVVRNKANCPLEGVGREPVPSAGSGQALSFAKERPTHEEPRADRAKRTQFRPSRPSRAPIVPIFHHSSIPVLRVGRGTIVQNEPNFGGPGERGAES